MAIDISKDLVISTLARDYLTPTITGSYDSGQPAGTYVPGKDFSATDDVSIGNTVVYNISFSFNSLSNQIYSLDQVYIQSVDDPRTDGTGNILGRWINQDSNPQNITDDGQNTPVYTSSYFSQMTSVVFDSTSNIKSSSTISTSITVALPSSFIWKTKIMPQIQVVAVKDGITKVSAPLQLATVNFSSAANLVSTLSQTSSITYTDTNALTGFKIPFSITTAKQNIVNITPLADNPLFNLITYVIDFGVTVQSNNIPLSTSSFTFGTIDNGQIQSFSYSSGTLTIVVKQTAQASYIKLNGVAFASFDGTGIQQALVTLSGNWAVSPPVITAFTNQYLFTQSTAGNLSFSGMVNVQTVNPGNLLTMRENINFAGGLQQISQSLTIKNYDAIKTQGSQFIRYIDSNLAYFSENLTPLYSFYDTNVGNNVTNAFLSSQYTLLFGYYAFPSGSYDPNYIGQSVVNGTIALAPYEQIIASGYKPNIMSFTINVDLFAGGNIDTTQPYSFSFLGDLTQIAQSEFQNYYNSNPQSSYTNKVYSYMHLNTSYANITAALSDVGTLLSYVDLFSQTGSNIFLNLGTLFPPPTTVTRFNDSSNQPVSVYNYNALSSNLVLGLYDTSWNTVSSVNDYTKEYCLGIKTNNAPGQGYVNSTIGDNTVVTLEIPTALVPYLYISGTPVIQSYLTGLILTTEITDFTVIGNNISLTMPRQTVIYPDRICIPVRFIIPSQTLSTNGGQLSYSTPLYYSDDPTSLLYGFNTTTQMFNVLYQINNFQLLGAEQDTTGLSVAPPIYNRGEVVSYIACVDNVSFIPSSSYYMSLTVPTNQYNPVQTSDNSILSFITGIDSKNTGTQIYYQTATNATAQDIAQMKKQPNTGISLQNYFNNTIVNSWRVFTTSQALPNNVVMFVGFVPNVPNNNIARIDYTVQMQIPPTSESLYVNDAVFNYYSTGSSLESQSNIVQIKNRIAEAIPIQKYYNNNLQPLINGTRIPFEGYFNAPLDTVDFQNFTLTDTLDPSLTFDATNTNAYLYPNTPINFTSHFDTTTNTVTINIANTPQTAGSIIRVVLGTILQNTTLVPNSMMINNTMELIVNNNTNLTSISNTVQVPFTSPQITNPIPITKTPVSQTIPLQNGTPIIFTAQFQTPSDYRYVLSYQLTDSLHQSLTVDTTQCSVVVGNIVAPDAMIFLDPTSNTLNIMFMSNNPAYSGQTATVTIYALLQDVTLVPPSNIISNQISLNPGNPSLNSLSNTVYVDFFSVNPVPVTKAPATQTKPLVNGTPVVFTTTFNAPSDISNYKDFTIVDALHPSLKFDSTNTTVKTSNNVAVAYMANVDTTTNTLSIDFMNNAAMAGKAITATIATVVSDITQIPSNLTITNSANLVINSNPAYQSTSNVVDVVFQQPAPTPVPVTKAPSTQIKPLVNGTPVVFTVTFNAPSDISSYKEFTIIDQLHASLEFDGTNTVVKTSDGIVIANKVSMDMSSNTLSIDFTNNTDTAGKVITATIATIVSDITQVPQNMTITNMATLQVNEDSTLTSQSNVVSVLFKSVQPLTPCQQAIADIIESVALEQMALSHILNAEGEKIQKALALNLPLADMLKVNQSVEGMTNAITVLESILHQKLGIFDNGDYGNE